MSRPLLHFLVLGALLFAAERWLVTVKGETVAAPPGEVAALERQWAVQTGRSPDSWERERLQRIAADDQLLYREALARGFAAHDVLVERRLARNMRFLGREGEEMQLARDALALGMHESDLVVRRRLIQKLRLEIESHERLRDPSERELEEHLARHRDRFAVPARARISQLYWSREREGAPGEVMARAALERLRSGGAAQDAQPPSDTSLLARDLPLRSEAQLAASFGSEFASAIFQLAPGGWRGPVRSSFGAHLVWVHERQSERPALLWEVRTAIHDDLQSERARSAVGREVALLRDRYGVAP